MTLFNLYRTFILENPSSEVQYTRHIKHNREWGQVTVVIQTTESLGWDCDFKQMCCFVCERWL